MDLGKGKGQQRGGQILQDMSADVGMQRGVQS